MHNCNESRAQARRVAHDIEMNAVHSEVHGHFFFFFTIITANMNLAMAVCILFLQGPLTGTLTLRVSCAQLAAADTIAETSKSETIAEVGWVVGG